LGGLRPWAWSPDAVRLLEPLAADVSLVVPWRWREPLPCEWLSKAIGLRLEEGLGVGEKGALCVSVEEALDRAAAGPSLLKAVHACAGRGHFRVEPGEAPDAVRAWVSQAIAKHGAVVVEPWLRRVADFSALYEM